MKIEEIKELLKVCIDTGIELDYVDAELIRDVILQLEAERFDFAHAYYTQIKDADLIKKAFEILTDNKV